MSNTSWDESALIFVVRVDVKVQILQVLSRNMTFINSVLLSQYSFVSIVRRQIDMSAVKLHFKLSATFVLLISNDLIDSACDYEAWLDVSFEFLLSIHNHELIFGDDSDKSILETTYYFVVSDDLGDCSRHNLAHFESSLRFIDQQVE